MRTNVVKVFILIKNNLSLLLDKESERPFLPSSALEMIRNGNVESIPLMIGVTSQEGAWLMAAFYGQDNKTLLKSFQDNLKTAISALTAHFFSEEVILKVLNQFLLINAGIRGKFKHKV